MTPDDQTDDVRPTSHPVNEAGLLFGLLVEGTHGSGEMADRLVECLEVDAFTAPYRIAAWAAVLALRRDGHPITFGTLLPRMTVDGWTSGHAEMVEIETAGDHLSVTYRSNRDAFRLALVLYAQYVLDAFVRRQIVLAAKAGAHDASVRPGAASEVLDVMARRLEAVTAYGRSFYADTGGARRAARFRGAIERRLDPSASPATKTPWPDLNSVLGGGLVPGRLYVVAGRPAMGKSTAAWNLASWAALHERRGVRCVSYEEDVNDVLLSMACSTARCPKSGTLTDSQATQVQDAMARLKSSQLDVEEPGREEPFTLARLLALVGTWKATGTDVVVLDYLQLIPLGPGGRQSRESRRHEEVAEISRSLKRAALQHGVAVVVTAQLNRAVESRGNHRPALSDLRESGSIEQDADVVLLMFRPGYYAPTDADLEGKAELIVAKNRHGEAGRSVELHFDGAMGRFSNVASNWSTPANAPATTTAAKPVVDWGA